MIKVRAVCTLKDNDADGNVDLSGSLIVVQLNKEGFAAMGKEELSGVWALDASEMYCSEHVDCYPHWKFVTISEL